MLAFGLLGLLLFYPKYFCFFSCSCACNHIMVHCQICYCYVFIVCFLINFIKNEMCFDFPFELVALSEPQRKRTYVPLDVHPAKFQISLRIRAV